MTWEQMIQIEPNLKILYDEACQVKALDENFCANQVWYGPGGLKSRMMQLVGWEADGVLASEDCYDTAYRKIYEALPDCRHDHVFC